MLKRGVQLFEHRRKQAINEELIMNSTTPEKLFFFLIVASSFLYSQAPQVEWGKVDRDILAMQSFPADTNAAAIILYDVGNVTFDSNFDIVFTCHRRIKILNERGKDWGTIILSIDENSNRQRIKKIEGITYNLNSEGVLITTKLTPKEIFKEPLHNGIYCYRIALPGVTVGSVLEYKYTIISKGFGYIPDWQFQFSEPCLWSEYKLIAPINFAFNNLASGSHPFFIYEITDTTQAFHGSAPYLLGGSPARCNVYHWAVKDAPAVREEPYMTTCTDYITKVYIQPSEYILVGKPSQKILENWTKVVNDLVDYNYFGKLTDATSSVRKLTKSIVQDTMTSEEKLKALYTWVSTSITTTSTDRLFGDRRLDDILESKKGTNAEVNFLFLSMVKTVGLTGYPVIISTRDHGKIIPFRPIIQQFNCVLSMVEIDTVRYFLDPTDNLRPFGMLPPRFLNVQGLVVQKDQERWVTIPSNEKDQRHLLAQVTLNEDGSLQGSLIGKYTGYSALSLRRELQEKKVEDVVKGCFDTDALSLEIDSINIQAKDDITQPLKIQAFIHSETYAQIAGDYIYFNPHIMDRMRSNPFKSPKRDFPISFLYPMLHKFYLTLTYPNTYEPENIPVEERAYIIGRTSIYNRKVAVDGNIIQVIRTFEQTKLEYKPEEYDRLRAVYERRVADANIQIAFKKKAITPSQQAQPAQPVSPTTKKSSSK